jgi:peptide/nickel transport system ATP-binding protein
MANSQILQINQLNVKFRSGERSRQTRQEIAKETATEKSSAIHNLNLTLQQGETLGIVGESGSGKSVTALALLGLLPETAIATGEIWFTSQAQNPVNLLALPKSQMRQFRGSQIGIIFQEPMTALNPLFSCGYQILETISQHQSCSASEAKEIAIHLLEEVKLPQPQQILDRYPHELSGGQLQRLMIAIAICANPVLLIADEPTTALDVTIQASILALLKQIQSDRQMSMIFISHDLGVIRQIADRILVMREGEMVESQPMADLFIQPQHPYTKGLIACRPQPDQNFKYLPTVQDFDQSGKLISDRFKIQISAAETENRLEKLATKPPLLVVENLRIEYPVRGVLGNTQRYNPAVQDVSFKLQPGETLGLVGESGCGKTSLSRAILRLIPISSGKIWFDNQEITKLPHHSLRQLRRNLQVIFQDPYSSLNPRLTVGAAIAEPLLIHQIYQSPNRQQKIQARVKYLLERVGLDPKLSDRYPHQFSGGQRQRICIARALALNPKLIIADEPVSALDVSVQAQVLNLLKELQFEFDLTYIFISHDLSVVKFMSDRILVMYEGKIAESGTAEQIYRTPKEEYTKRLIASIPNF